MADTTTFEAAAYSAQGTPRDKQTLPAETFDGTINVPVMHQAVKAFLANQRQGTHATKTRGFVIGGNQKPWKQKGTGRARSGSTRSPVWVGGGTVFGPTPRKYTEIVPRQVRALARKSALNARASENALFIIDAFQYDAPKTSRLQQLLARLDVATKKVLILTDGNKPNVHLSGRNLPSVWVLPYSDVSTYHILWSDVVLVESGALGTALAPLAEKEVANVKVKKAAPKAEAPAKAAKKTAVKKTAAAPKAAAKKAPAAKKTAAKPAAAKAPAKKTAAPKKKGK
jgi:large subunit ribosomal protein L4